MTKIQKKKIRNIFLDLDSTLIQSVEIDKIPEKGEQKKQFVEKMKKFSYKNMENYYLVFQRPFLQEFLDYLFENFNVSVFTAASKDYAIFIIEKFILTNSSRKLDYIFFDYHTDISEETTRQHKSIKMIQNLFKLPNYTTSNTIIIDDNIDVYEPQNNNCIIAIPFHFKTPLSENDDYLSGLINRLKLLQNNNITIKDINDEYLSYLKNNNIKLTGQDTLGDRKPKRYND